MEPTIDRVTVKAVRVEVAVQPLQQVVVPLTAPRRRRRQQVAVAPHPAAVLRRPGPLAGDTERVGQALVRPLDGAHDDVMPPVIAEVVGVDERRADGRGDGGARYEQGLQRFGRQPVRVAERAACRRRQGLRAPPRPRVDLGRHVQAGSEVGRVRQQIERVGLRPGGRAVDAGDSVHHGVELSLRDPTHRLSRGVDSQHLGLSGVAAALLDRPQHPRRQPQLADAPVHQAGVVLQCPRCLVREDDVRHERVAAVALHHLTLDEVGSVGAERLRRGPVRATRRVGRRVATGAVVEDRCQRLADRPEDGQALDGHGVVGVPGQLAGDLRLVAERANRGIAIIGTEMYDSEIRGGIKGF